MIKYLNFLYRGYEFAKPRFGVKETFWVFLFSLLLGPIDTIIMYNMHLSSTDENLMLFYIIVTTTVRCIPLFIIKPFTKNSSSSLYAYDGKQKYWINSVLAIVLFLIFVGLPNWLGAIFSML